MPNLVARSAVILGAFLISLWAAGLTYAAHEAAGTKQTTINVGIYAPFSNESAFIGRHILGAMEMARDQLHSSYISYSFYTLDKIVDKRTAAYTLQKFIDAHHINVLLTQGSDSGILAAPLAKKNKLIHFCLANDPAIADGKNNFLARSPNHQQEAVLLTAMKPEFIAQFKRDFFSHPVTEAGYAFDIFQILHSSALIARKSNSNFSSAEIASQILALESGTGVMGTFNLDEKGVSYNKKILTA